jgi:hypothetical protein
MPHEAIDTLANAICDAAKAQSTAIIYFCYEPFTQMRMDNYWKSNMSSIAY